MTFQTFQQKVQKITYMALMTLGLSCLSACVTQTSGSEITKFNEPTRAEKKENAVKIRTQLAVEYMNNRDYRAATQAIEQAIKIDDKYDIAWLIRAQIYQALKLYSKADESFRRALTLSPNSPEINNNYGWYLCEIKKRPSEGIVYFNKALADPTYPTPEVAYLNKGLCHAKMNQNGLAEGYFEQALRMNNGFVPVLKEQARLKFNENNLPEADRLFKQYQSKVNLLSPDDLLLGWKIVRAQGETQAAYEYEAQLRQNYPYSEELKAITTGNEQ